MSELNKTNDLKYLFKLRYDKASLIDYNNVKLEDVLPGLFFVTRTGRRRGEGEKENRHPQHFADMLLENAAKYLVGFDSPAGRVLLTEWLQTSVLRLVESGSRDKVSSIRPLHFLTYRTGLPPYWVGLRSIPEFTAAILHKDTLHGPERNDKDEVFALGTSTNLFWKRFGVGFRESPTSLIAGDGYDDEVDVDIEALLAIRLVGQMRPPNEATAQKGKKGGYISGFDPLAPQQAKIFRQDFSLFLRAYPPGCIPMRLLGDSVLCLLSLNLTVYSLHHMHMLNSLYYDGKLVDDGYDNAGQRLWTPGIYVDVTGVSKNRKSRDLARASFKRHHAWMLQHIRAMIGFRLLDYFLKNRVDIAAVKEINRLRDTGEKSYLVALAQARQPNSGKLYDALQAAGASALSAMEEAQHDGWPASLKSVAADDSLSPFDRLVELVSMDEHNLQGQVVKYFQSVARRRLESGLMDSSGNKVDDHYYTLGNQVVETLVQLLILKDNRSLKAKPIDIYQFVEKLRTKYGIYIDRPPKEIGGDTYESRVAGQQNLEAFKERLRQLGFFRSVTDARRMQRLTPRYQPAGDLTSE